MLNYWTIGFSIKSTSKFKKSRSVYGTYSFDETTFFRCLIEIKTWSNEGIATIISLSLSLLSSTSLESVS